MNAAWSGAGVMDMNDRALRDMVVSLGGVSNGFPRQNRV